MGSTRAETTAVVGTVVSRIRRKRPFSYLTLERDDCYGDVDRNAAFEHDGEFGGGLLSRQYQLAFDPILALQQGQARYHALEGLLRPGARLSAVGRLDLSRGGGGHSTPTLRVSQFDVLACDGKWTTLQRLTELVARGVLSREEVCLYFSGSSLGADARRRLDEACALQSSGPGASGELKRHLLRWSRVLAGQPEARAVRLRPPRHSAEELRALSAAERAAAPLWVVPPPSNPAVATPEGARAVARAEAAGALDVAGALGAPLASASSGRGGCGDGSRGDHARLKKGPQLRWFVGQLAPTIAALARRASSEASAAASSTGQRAGQSSSSQLPPPPPPPPVHVLDVGGGRGDLGIALAAASSAETPCRVTVLDPNARSLAAGEARARALGLGNVVFALGALRGRGGAETAEGAEAEGAEAEGAAAEGGGGGGGATTTASAVPPLAVRPLEPDSEPGPGPGLRPWRGAPTDLSLVDLVVGLHCCGGLADAALALAADRGLPFLVCPCCFHRHRKLGLWGALFAHRATLQLGAIQ